MSEVCDSHRGARDELRARNKQAVELKTALGVMEAAQGLSISLDELQAENVPIAAAHLPHILGRGRAAPKELRSECGVAIDMRPAPRPTREEREANGGGGSGRRGERGAGPSGARPVVALVVGHEHGVAGVRERLFALQRSVVEWLPGRRARMRGGARRRRMATQIRPAKTVATIRSVWLICAFQHCTDHHLPHQLCVVMHIHVDLIHVCMCNAYHIPGAV